MKQTLKDYQKAMKNGYDACIREEKPINPFLHKQGFSLLAQSWLLGFKIAKEEYFNSEEYILTVKSIRNLNFKFKEKLK